MAYCFHSGLELFSALQIIAVGHNTLKSWHTAMINEVDNSKLLPRQHAILLN